ncbi:MAG: Ig-like domain-containing protein [Desulfitobacteriaceae bacterium]
MKRYITKVVISSLLLSIIFWSNPGLCFQVFATNDTAAQSETTAQDSTQTTGDQSTDDILNLAVLIKNNNFVVAGESSAASVYITIKDTCFVIVKQVSANVTNGRFEWKDRLTNYTAEETYKVTVVDDLGNTASNTVTIPKKEEDYTLNLAVLTSGGYLTVAGESSCAEVNISIKNGRFKEVQTSTVAVSNGRFEWRKSLSNFTPEEPYHITVTDTEGHAATDTATIPDTYTLTVTATAKDDNLKVVGESSSSEVIIAIKDSNLSNVQKRNVSVKNKRYVWNESLTHYKEDETYKIIVTDPDDHTATVEITIPITVKSIEFGDYEKKLEVEKSLSLTTTVMPSGAENQTVKYTSSDDRIAAVSSSGKVTAHNTGKVTITATCGSASVNAEFTVYIKTLKLEANANYLTMLPEDTFQISTEILPITAEQKCTYTSTNENVLSVTPEGRITAKKSGVASVILSNGDVEGIITVIVNGGHDDKMGTSFRSSNSDTSKEHIESSQLASIIHDKDAKEIILNNTDLKLIDASALCLLKDENKNLIVEKETYLIMIKGQAIVNPANAFSVDIPIEYVEDNIKFVVNDNQPLPGQITIHLYDERVLNKKYLYLYNSVKNKYEEIDSYNSDDKRIYVDKGGTYLITEKKLLSSAINPIATGAAGGFCTVLGVGYLVTKKKYWFY